MNVLYVIIVTSEICVSGPRTLRLMTDACSFKGAQQILSRLNHSSGDLVQFDASPLYDLICRTIASEALTLLSFNPYHAHVLLRLGVADIIKFRFRSVFYMFPAF